MKKKRKNNLLLKKLADEPGVLQELYLTTLDNFGKVLSGYLQSLQGRHALALQNQEI